MHELRRDASPREVMLLAGQRSPIVDDVLTRAAVSINNECLNADLSR